MSARVGHEPRTGLFWELLGDGAPGRVWRTTSDAIADWYLEAVPRA